MEKNVQPLNSTVDMRINRTPSQKNEAAFSWAPAKAFHQSCYVVPSDSTIAGNEPLWENGRKR
jgi:hypothetical protein